MRFNRLTSLALCLGVVFLIMTGSAVAGTTSFNSGNALTYAKEVGALNGVYTMPAATNVNRTMNVIRSTGQNFFVDAILDNGATWVSGLASGSLSVIGVATYTPTLITAASGTATFLVTITGATENQYPTVVLNVSGVVVKDTNNIIGTTGTINLTLQTRDSATGVIIDQNSDQVPFMTGKYGVSLVKLSAGAAVIDVATGRKKFVVDTNVTTTQDGTAYFQIDKGVSGVLAADGGQFTMITASVDNIDFIITGDLSGITSITIGPITKAIDADALAASSVKITLGAGDLAAGAPSTYFQINVIGNLALNTRTLNVTINLNMVQLDAAGGENKNDRNLISNATLTTWTLNGTVLVAQWVNGNNSALNSRIYLWNKSSVAGMVTIDVYTLPNSTAGSVKLGTIDYGTLLGSSSVNIKLAEDVLNPLGITLPYTDNGGNLTLVITIRATGVTGISQTFSLGFAYGTYVLSAGN